MPSLDTNVLLRLILQDQPKLVAQAKELLAKHDMFAVADVAILEVIYVLGGYYEYTRQEIVGVINQLIRNQHLNLNRPLFERVLPLYAAHPTESISDCCLATYAKLNNATPLYTFDKKFARDVPPVDLVH